MMAIAICQNLQAEVNRLDINNGYLCTTLHLGLQSTKFSDKNCDRNLESAGLLLAVPFPGQSPSKTLGSIISHLLAVVPEKLEGTLTR